MCCIKHALAVQRNDGTQPDYRPSSSEIDEALTARKALGQYLRPGDVNRLSAEYRKSLSSFSFGANQFLLPPQLSNQIISCLVEGVGISSLVNQAQTSSGSLVFMIDNVRMNEAAFACESGCWANNPQADLQAGLGQLEIKAESIRAVVCATRDLIEDSSFGVEAWLTRKLNDAFRRTIERSIIFGDGVGKPTGLLHPSGGVPVCETSPLTDPGKFSWQDLVMLKYEIPEIWHANGRYIMNGRTYALLSTMSDAVGRPIWFGAIQNQPQQTIDGSPITISSFMPDVAPGSTPILFGDLRAAYTMVVRKGFSIQTDPFTAGWCLLYKADARIGGAPTCSNACRLLRIR